MKARILHAIPNASRYWLDLFVREAADSLQPGAIMLDVGCGPQPYRHHFDHVTYESADMRWPATYQCDLMRGLPAECRERFDLVLCTQVLEHVDTPARALTELHDALKPGGALWLSAPLMYREHEAPHDYFRYTRHGLSHLLEQGGFEVVRIDRLEGYWGALGYEAAEACRDIPVSPRAYGPLSVLGSAFALVAKPTLYILAHVLHRLDVRVKLDHGMYKNTAVVARKVVDA